MKLNRNTDGTSQKCVVFPYFLKNSVDATGVR